MSTEEQQARINKGVERLRKQKEIEAEKDEKYFLKMTTGWRWLYFRIGMIFCLLLAILITIETFFDGDTIQAKEPKYTSESYSSDYQSIWVDEDFYLIKIDQLQGIILESIEIHTAPITGDSKYISFRQSYYDENHQLGYYLRKTDKDNSVYTWFPLVQLMLLIPFLVFIFKRRTMPFIFTYFACLALILPGSVVLFITLIF